MIIIPEGREDRICIQNCIFLTVLCVLLNRSEGIMETAYAYVPFNRHGNAVSII